MLHHNRYKPLATVLEYTLLTAVLFTSSILYAASPPKIAIISSYHKDYLWTEETNLGVLKSLKAKNYINDQEAIVFTQNDSLSTNKIMLKKWWLNSKRKNTLPEIQQSLIQIINELNHFQPDIILTGDDNATNYLGNYYIDSETPLVFWGVNGSPMKYGLLDSLEHPGRNITGVYQADYIKEAATFLKNLLPHIKNIAVLSDDSVTSRAKLKKLIRLSESGELPLTITHITVTNKLLQWQSQALDAAKNSDSFFILNHQTLRDKDGQPVHGVKIAAWYLRNIKKPEISPLRTSITEGMLAAVSDSGIKQGFLAMEKALRILDGEHPKNIPVTAPKLGDYIVNKDRAKTLKIYDSIKNNTNIEAWVENSLALDQYPE